MNFDGDHKLEMSGCRLHVRPASNGDCNWAADGRVWVVVAAGPTSAFSPGDVIACSLERVLTIDDKEHAITNDCLVIARHEKGCGCQR